MVPKISGVNYERRVYTADHKPSAQWEITVLVTEDGSEVLAW